MSTSDSGEHFDAGERRRNDLRAAVGEIGAYIAHLPGGASAAKNGLPESWAKLVRLLDLGPALEVRRCPACGSVGMRMATRCGHCWALLVPPDTRSGASQAPGGVAES